MTDKRTTSTTTSPIESQLSTSSTRPTISPFYYGFNFKKITTIYPSYKSFTTQNPFGFKEFEFNHLQTTSTTVHTPFAFSFPLTTTTTQSTLSKSAQIASTSPLQDHTPLPPDSLASSTRNPVFDVYLKRVASTTKNPYDFANFGQYFKTTTTTSTPFSFNLLSANSNTAAFSENIQRKQSITRS